MKVPVAAVHHADTSCSIGPDITRWWKSLVYSKWFGQKTGFFLLVLSKEEASLEQNFYHPLTRDENVGGSSNYFFIK